MREKLELTPHEARVIIEDSNPDYLTVHEELVGTSKWSNTFYIVVKRLSDGKHFADHYSIGASDSQEEAPYEFDMPDFTEVEKVTKVIEVWE